MEQVDQALLRMDEGTYGLCETCRDPIERERLLADPLIRYCLDHLSPEERRSLQLDLELASRVQRALLPKPALSASGWEARFHYEPAGPVSGDYCDLVGPVPGEEDLFFLFGDVSGKGVAASMLMARLHAILRALIDAHLSAEQIMGRANRLFCESALPASFATLVCGHAGRSGDVEIGNAGHCPPLLVRGGRAARIAATGVPVGLFCSVEYTVERVHLGRGDTLFLYTDGLSEARNPGREEYGVDRISRLVEANHAAPVPELIRACLGDLEEFRAGAPKTDDLTLMAIRRTE
jgi:sigma-B regulation protein RsbU (phosphoserine phosphatase)